VPEMLCSASSEVHAGTTDADVQVNLEIAAGAVQGARLEQALANAEFAADPERIWRWQVEIDGQRAVVKFELLADLDYAPQEAVIEFDNCSALGAVNLRGTGFAAQDFVPTTLRARLGGIPYEVSINVTRIAGFLLAKTAAAYGRRKEKDWYDIAFVLLHNDLGGPEQAATVTRERFKDQLSGSIRTALDDLMANFEHPETQGPAAYARQRLADDPGAADDQLRADAVLAVRAFHTGVTGIGRSPQ
jgi:hypothetical protein